MGPRVLIVDDHEVIRDAVSDLLKSRGFLVAGCAACLEEALSILSAVDVDVVVLDVRLKNEDAFEALDAIREVASEVIVVVFSAYDNPTYVARAVALGAADYVLKLGDIDLLLRSVENAAAKREPPAASLLMKIRNTMWNNAAKAPLPSDAPFTEREYQVLRHMSLGLSNKDIARSLAISVETVKEHVQNILRKFGAADRTDAAVKAIKLGWVD